MLYAAFYKSIHDGLPGVYNRAVRWWTRSKYSHVELVFSDGIAASASYMDGGVRFKDIGFDDGKWDIVELAQHLELPARRWFAEHAGQKYDLLGNIHFVISAIGDDDHKWFCSEAVAAALGMPTPARFDPGTLYAALLFCSANRTIEKAFPSTILTGATMDKSIKPQPKEEIPQTQDTGNGTPPPKDPPKQVPNRVATESEDTGNGNPPPKG